ncbi:MAG: O-antigen ligase family protein, partial [Pseudorhodoplanes sp.]
MITLDDARLQRAVAAQPARLAPSALSPFEDAKGWLERSPASPLADASLRSCLYICVVSGFLVSIQPAPYDLIFLLLCFICLIARVSFDRGLVPIVLLLTILQLAGLASALPVLDDSDVWNFMGISIYLAITVPVFGAILTQDTERRLNTYRKAVVFSAVIAAVLGMIGYFQLIPQYEMFMMNNRAVATFKDPNGFGPYLIPPLLLTLERFVKGEVRPLNLIASLLIATGLLLSFSRGAWGNFVLSFAVMLSLMFVTATGPQDRKRIVVFVLVGLVAVLVLFGILYSIESVRDMLLQRARLVQEYDTGTSGARFNVQRAAITEILQNINGMGGWVFGKLYGLVTHNSYLGAFVNHGWIGGFAYIGLVLTTIYAGFRFSLVRTPWQGPLIAVFCSFIGLAAESFIVDSVDGRLLYELLGVVWGL